MKFRRAFIPVVAVLLGLWLFLGLVVVPHLLESAYRGASFSLMNRAVAAVTSVSIDFILAQWLDIVLIGAPVILALGALACVLGRPETTGRIVGEATPGDIGAIRMLVCGVLLVSTLWEDLASTAALPRELMRPMGILQLFYLLPIGFDRFAASPVALRVFNWIATAVLFLGMIGWKTRYVLPLGAVCYLILGGLLRQYAWFYHTGLVALYLLIVLIILPSHHGASLDRLVKLWKGEPVPPSTPSRQYGWMRYALWSTLALPYFMAGLSKLRNGGLTWWEASNFKFILFQSSLRPMEFDFDMSLLLTSAPDVAFEVLAISALLGEILYGLVLFSRLARWIMPAVMLLMHLGILLLQNILFFDLIVLQVIFFNLRPLRETIARALARRKDRLTLTFDGANPAHRRLVRVIKAVDLFDRIDPRAEDDRGAVGHRHTRTRGSSGHEPGRVGALTGVYASRQYSGKALWQLIARCIPVLWLTVPLTYIPKWFDRVAVWASNHPNPEISQSGRRISHAGAAGPRLTLVLTSILAFLWLFRIEYYPFTAMQMFSKKRSEPVTYEIALAHVRSGEVVRAPVERSIRSMSDSRYRRVLDMAFDPEGVHVAAAFFDSVQERWNLNAPSEAEMIVGFEIQRWEWYYLSQPHDPNFGRLVESTAYPKNEDDDVDVAPANVSVPSL